MKCLEVAGRPVDQKRCRTGTKPIAEGRAELLAAPVLPAIPVSLAFSGIRDCPSRRQQLFDLIQAYDEPSDLRHFSPVYSGISITVSLICAVN